MREDNGKLHRENFIHQRGPTVVIRNGGKQKCKIECKNGLSARRVALSLAGVTEDEVNNRKNIYLKNLKHPWHGILILESKSKSNSVANIAVRIRALSNSDSLIITDQQGIS